MRWPAKPKVRLRFAWFPHRCETCEARCWLEPMWWAATTFLSTYGDWYCREHQPSPPGPPTSLRPAATDAPRLADPSLGEIALGLEQARRIGASGDKPEGVRYIKVSDTLAGRIAAALRAHDCTRRAP